MIPKEREERPSRRTSVRLRVEDVTGKFPGILGVSNNTHDLVDSCVYMGKRIIDDMVADSKKGLQRDSVDLLDKATTLGPNAGALTLHMLPDLTERLMGCDISSTSVELHPGDGETTDLSLKVDVKIVKEYNPLVKLVFGDLMRSHIARFVEDKTNLGN